MSYDTVASLQRMEQLKQAEAAAGNKLILKRTDTKLEIALTAVAILLSIPTLGISLLLFLIYFLLREFAFKTYLVKNVATGETFRVDKQDFKQYKREFKAKEKEVRKISDL
ncbi:TPA: hypothetical protein QCX75_000243 [Bacillus mycoides]|uniref:hypothetical protein n=1 Tax=Bacillus sp. FSL P2-0099 TaxID=2921572 RepID=UPI0030F6C989|nr:hypothetical protein [Bacillus mycoides]